MSLHSGSRGSTSSDGATGLPAVVVPHYDNAEGGHHDTRFCYLGERRLAHDGGHAAGGRVHPRRRRTHRRRAGHRGLDRDRDRQRHDDDPPARAAASCTRAGTVLAFGDLLPHEHPAGATAIGAPGGAPIGPPSGRPVRGPSSLRRATLHTDADRLLRGLRRGGRRPRHTDACVGAILELEQLITDWSADTIGRPVLRAHGGCAR